MPRPSAYKSVTFLEAAISKAGHSSIPTLLHPSHLPPHPCVTKSHPLKRVCDVVTVLRAWGNRICCFFDFWVFVTLTSSSRHSSFLPLKAPAFPPGGVALSSLHLLLPRPSSPWKFSPKCDKIRQLSEVFRRRTAARLVKQYIKNNQQNHAGQKGVFGA